MKYGKYTYDAFGDPSPSGSVLQEAADWLARVDRGLSPRERDEFYNWLAMDSAHSDAFTRQRRTWNRLNTLADWRPEHAADPNPDLLAPTPGPLVPWWRRTWSMIGLLGAVAAAWLVLASVSSTKSPPKIGDYPPVAEAKEPEPHHLPDGSLVFAKADAEYTIDYGERQRRIQLLRGEAYFRVAKDVDRPFVVATHGLELRALGTAFNVRLGNASLELLVEEGVVALDNPREEKSLAHARESQEANQNSVRVLRARERAIVRLEPGAGLNPQVDSLSPGELKRVIAWQHRKLHFFSQPLHEIVAEFNRLNDTQMLLQDETLAGIEISGTIHSSNIEGFTRLLEAGFGIHATMKNQETIFLFDPTRKIH